MAKSVYSKLITGFLVSIIISFTISYFIAFRSNFEQVKNLNKNQLKVRCSYVVSLIEKTDTSLTDELISQYAQSNDLNINIKTANSNITYGKKNNSLTDFNDIDIENNESFTVNDSIYSYTLVTKIKGEEYIITILEDNSNENNIFINSMFMILGIVFLAGSIIFLIVADFIVKPITKLTAMTQELSKGNYKVRVNYSGDDEISRLNQGFNQMAIQLAKQDETRQKFISDISHEFQTPLTSIQGFAKILKEEDLPANQRAKYADIILFNSKRLSTLAKNMLQLTMLEREEIRLDISNYSLVNQLNRVIAGETYSAEAKNIEIVFNKPKKDILIDADEGRLEQVWTNILTNSIKYTNPNGLITIDIRRTLKDIEVSIEDTGIGMSKESLSHIFERFYREDKARNKEGNGLGLSIVKSIVDLHGGKIDVISQVDVGTTFIVHLPFESKSLKERLNLK